MVCDETRPVHYQDCLLRLGLISPKPACRKCKPYLLKTAWQHRKMFLRQPWQSSRAVHVSRETANEEKKKQTWVICLEISHTVHCAEGVDGGRRGSHTETSPFTPAQVKIRVGPGSRLKHMAWSRPLSWAGKGERTNSDYQVGHHFSVPLLLTWFEDGVILVHIHHH